jgi:hypothetical protein
MEVTISGTDVAGDPLQATTSWRVDGGAFVSGLPAGLSLSSHACTLSGNSRTCPWTLSGYADVSAGTYVVRVTVEDDDLGQSSIDLEIVVVSENVIVRFHGGNPRAVRVANAGDDNSGPFALQIDIKELYPDNGTSVLPGDISEANANASLVPIGPGGTVSPTGCTSELHDVDYDARLTVTCAFDAVPINTYVVEVQVDGGYYDGLAEDVVTIYDPSLGFTTGGGTFIWPGSDDPGASYSGDETSFGFTIEYNKNGKNIKGRLMLIRQLADGSFFSIKSNALDGLALGKEGSFTWATFSGKTTYTSPGNGTLGNYNFIAYVEDHGDADDRFWLQVKDKDGVVVLTLSMDDPAADSSVFIDANTGNITVP